MMRASAASSFAARAFPAEGFAAGVASADFGLARRTFIGVVGFAAFLAPLARRPDRARTAGLVFADGFGAGFAATRRLAFAVGRAGFFATRVRRNVDLAMAAARDVMRCSSGKKHAPPRPATPSFSATDYA